MTVLNTFVSIFCNMLHKVATFAAVRASLIIRSQALSNRTRSSSSLTLLPLVRTINHQRSLVTPLLARFAIKRGLTTTISSSKEHKVCWKCNHVVPQIDLHCSNDECGVIQSTPKDINFFETLEAGLGENA